MRVRELQVIGIAVGGVIGIVIIAILQKLLKEIRSISRKMCGEEPKQKGRIEELKPNK